MCGRVPWHYMLQSDLLEFFALIGCGDQKTWFSTALVPLCPWALNSEVTLTILAVIELVPLCPSVLMSPILLFINTAWVRSPVSGWCIQVSTLRGWQQMFMGVFSCTGPKLERLYNCRLHCWRRVSTVDTSILPAKSRVGRIKESASIQPLLNRSYRLEKGASWVYNKSAIRERVHNYKVKSLPHV